MQHCLQLAAIAANPAFSHLIQEKPTNIQGFFSRQSKNTSV
jgi:hypothetical protein